MDARSIAVLYEVRSLFEDPDKWTSGEYARTINGYGVDPLQPSAVKWCILGGICKVTGLSPKEVTYGPIVEMLESTARGDMVSDINDIDGRTAVLELIDEVLESVMMKETV